MMLKKGPSHQIIKVSPSTVRVNLGFVWLEGSPTTFGRRLLPLILHFYVSETRKELGRIDPV
jgi:hypothetical protein